MSTSFQKLVGAVLMGVILALVGYMVGQFAPFTGIATIAEPFSRVRNDTALAYAVIAGLIGVFVGVSVKPFRSKGEK